MRILYKIHIYANALKNECLEMDVKSAGCLEM